MKFLELSSFESWFNGSKVVDNRGRPLRMFHSTKNNIDSFHPATHFGSAKAARSRASFLTKGNPFGKTPIDGFKTYPVYLNIKNPLRVTDAQASEEASLLNAIKRGEYHPKLDLDIANREGAHAAAQAAGYDGLVYSNSFEDNGADSWVIFDPSQVRFALSNMSENCALKENEIIIESKSVKLDNGKRIIENPSRSDLLSMIASHKMLRGVLLDDVVYVWNGNSLIHWTVINNLGKIKKEETGNFPEKYVSFRIVQEAKQIFDSKFWDNTTPIDCNGFVAFATPIPNTHDFVEDIKSSKYLTSLFTSNVVITESNHDKGCIPPELPAQVRFPLSLSEAKIMFSKEDVARVSAKSKEEYGGQIVRMVMNSVGGVYIDEMGDSKAPPMTRKSVSFWFYPEDKKIEFRDGALGNKLKPKAQQALRELLKAGFIDNTWKIVAARGLSRYPLVKDEVDGRTYRSSKYATEPHPTDAKSLEELTAQAIRLSPASKDLIFYHGTSSLDWERIQKVGLLPLFKGTNKQNGSESRGKHESNTGVLYLAATPTKHMTTQRPEWMTRTERGTATRLPIVMTMTPWY